MYLYALAVCDIAVMPTRRLVEGDLCASPHAEKVRQAFLCLPAAFSNGVGGVGGAGGVAASSTRVDSLGDCVLCHGGLPPLTLLRVTTRRFIKNKPSNPLRVRG